MYVCRSSQTPFQLFDFRIEFALTARLRGGSHLAFQRLNLTHEPRTFLVNADLLGERVALGDFQFTDKSNDILPNRIEV